MLNKHNLAIAALAAKGESDFALQGILVTPEATVETDGHQLVRVTTPKIDPAKYPEMPDGRATKDFEPFVLPTKDALDILRGIPTKTKLPILANAAVLEGGDSPRLATTDLDRTRLFPIRPLPGNFPDYERVIPKLEGADFAVWFNAGLLRKVLKAVEDFRSDDPNRPCRLYFSGPTGALRIEAKNGEGQELTAVVMPMRDKVACPLYEQQKGALALAKRFRETVETHTGKEDWEIAAETHYHQVCELLDGPKPAEVVQIQAYREPEPEVIEPVVEEVPPVTDGPRSWQPEQFCERKWIPNGQRFATKEEAEQAAESTFSRWMGSDGHRAMPSEDAVNWRWVDGHGEMCLGTVVQRDSIIPVPESVTAQPEEKFTISYGSTPVGSFTVPQPEEPKPALTGLRVAGDLVYGSGGQIVAKLSRDEHGELRIGVHKNYEGDREELRVWVRTAVDLKTTAEAAQPAAKVTVSNNLRVMPSPAERPANWDELSRTSQAAIKAWETRRQKAGGGASTAPSQQPKPKSVKQQLADLEGLLGQLVQKMGPSEEVSHG